MFAKGGERTSARETTVPAHAPNMSPQKQYAASCHAVDDDWPVGIDLPCRAIVKIVQPAKKPSQRLGLERAARSRDI